MLMNRGYADRCGNPVPDKNREVAATTTNTMTTQNWTPAEINAYLAEKYGKKAVKPDGTAHVT